VEIAEVKPDNESIKVLRKITFKIMRKDHQLQALKELFTEEQLKVLQKNRERILSDSELSRIGIAQVSHDGKLRFIHRTFAEYYVADYMLNQRKKGKNTSKQVQTFILKDVFREAECLMFEDFMNALSSRSELSNYVLKESGNQIHDLGDDGEM
jgi:hypothetical protein